MATSRKGSTKRSSASTTVARRPRRRDTQLAFEALSIEGGLLSPEWLARVAALAADCQNEADYRVPKGLQLRDEIGRYWRIAQAHWSDFAAGRAHAMTPEAARALSERFALALLRECFGFASLIATKTQLIGDRSFPIGFAALGGRVPVVIAPAGDGLDTLAPPSGDGGRRRSAFGLAQEYLNSAENTTWGLATDGLNLRILRDNASLTRPAWVEADLSRIFLEERYADFAALWLLTHETRFGQAEQVSHCALENWREAGREEGTRAREHLRRGVEEALLALGQGFLAHPENSALRATLQNGTLSTAAYFQELLRLVYRLIFLLTVEERGLLHPEDPSKAAEEARRLYADGYGLRRLRERSLRRSAHDRFSDLWEATKITFRGVATGESRLALPALAGIFAPTRCPTLDAAKLENRALLLAVFRLSWLREASGLVRVNWRDMGPEELGSVYESLLELVPQVAQGGRLFAFATGGQTKGNARKTSGSYYTHDSLVQELLDSALEPLIGSTVATNLDRPAEALLALSVVDAACGSGHFLLAAGRRLAGHVARIEANGTPSAAQYRNAMRRIVGHCLYGVDLNPMAVELCKVSLWMEAVEPGLPLTFLDAHIRHGNALLGTTPSLMANGIPDAAWEPIEGDDRKVAGALKKRNRRSEGGQRALDTLWTKPAESETAAVARAIAELETASDATAEALARKEARWEDLLDSDAYLHQKLVADVWCAAFVWPKQPGPLQDAAPTNDVWVQIRDRQGQPNALTVKTTKELAELYRFFHWHLAFPQVFERGGFDVVLGNPPWDRVKLQESEFFASRSDEIASAPNAGERKRLIAALPIENPTLWADWRVASREANGQSHLLRQCGRYPLCGKGDVNTYALFAEHNRSLASPGGRAGFITPTGIATDETTSEFFAELIASQSLVTLFDFENREGLFPTVDSRFKFCLVTLRAANPDRLVEPAEFIFFAHRVDDLRDPERRCSLTADDLRLLNPNTLTCPVFRTRRDAEVTKAIYRRSSVLGAPSETDGWGVEYLLKLVDPTIHRNMLVDSPMSGDLRLDGSGESELLPLYEGKAVHQFDHRFGTFDGSDESRVVLEAEKTEPGFFVNPRYWLRPEDFRARMVGRPVRYRGFVSVRDITNVTNERTVVAAIRPFVPALNSLGNLFCRSAEDALFLTGCLNSFALDYVARQKLGGTHLSPFYLLQLAANSPAQAAALPSWAGTRVAQWVGERVLELTFTAWDLEPFARDAGYDGAPFHWNPDRRHLLRAELDAAFFQLFGLSRDDTAYILDTFPIVRRHDERAHGEYRTKRVILEIYDAMAEAARRGQPYATRLDPPPADPAAAHELRGLEIPTMPSIVPELPPDQEAAILIWALIRANGRSIHRTDLARAFALRAQPVLLSQMAPPSMTQTVQDWASAVGQRTPRPGLFAAALRSLADRSGVELITDSSSRSVVGLSLSAPPDAQIDPWFRFEARLALRVLRSQSEPDLRRIDAEITGDDRAFLGRVS